VVVHFIISILNYIMNINSNKNYSLNNGTLFSFITKKLKNNFNRKYGAVVASAVATVTVVSTALAVTIVPAGTTTDPVAQGYAGCTPGNCYVQSSGASSSLPTSATFGQILVWNGTNWVASSTLSATTSALLTTLNQTAISRHQLEISQAVL
jgi:hypothetical protein